MTEAEIVNTISRIEDKTNSNINFLASQIIDLQAKTSRLEFRLNKMYDTIENQGDDQHE